MLANDVGRGIRDVAGIVLTTEGRRNTNLVEGRQRNRRRTEESGIGTPVFNPSAGMFWL